MKANEILKKIRTEHNLTQQAACSLLGMPKRTWESWETGDRTPSDWMLNIVVEMLKIKIEEIEGSTWGSLSNEEEEFLAQEMNAVDGITGNDMRKDGECIIDLYAGLSVPGKVEDGEIVIDDEAIIYNPSK